MQNTTHLFKISVLAILCVGVLGVPALAEEMEEKNGVLHHRGDVGYGRANVSGPVAEDLMLSPARTESVYAVPYDAENYFDIAYQGRFTQNGGITYSWGLQYLFASGDNVTVAEFNNDPGQESKTDEFNLFELYGGAGYTHKLDNDVQISAALELSRVRASAKNLGCQGRQVDVYCRSSEIRTKSQAYNRLTLRPAFSAVFKRDKEAGTEIFIEIRDTIQEIGYAWGGKNYVSLRSVRHQGSDALGDLSLNTIGLVVGTVFGARNE